MNETKNDQYPRSSNGDHWSTIDMPKTTMMIPIQTTATTSISLSNEQKFGECLNFSYNEFITNQARICRNQEILDERLKCVVDDDVICQSDYDSRRRQ